MVLLSWKRYYLCKFPLHLWIVVDYGVVFVFRLLMFVDNALAAGMGLDYGRQQRDACFLGRVVILSILYVVLYPFLWAWSIMGSVWFTSAQTCLPEKNQKWGFLVWLIFSYCGLICLAGYVVNKWLTRRKAHLQRAQQGIPISGISEYGVTSTVLVDMIRLPDWVFETAAQEMRAMEQDTTPHHPGLYLSSAQVRGLPCAHNFHVACIDKWLMLNTKCPRCRCSVFPNLELNDLPNIPPDPDRSSTLSTTQHAQTQPISQSYLSRMQSFLLPIRSGNATSSTSTAATATAATAATTTFNSSTNSEPSIDNDSDVTLEIAENGGQASESHDPHTSVERVQ
ncbi:Zinc finger, RING/FYVE/PHD-type [Cynara cardunculus var. scolymus]|uniref:Zinc finger, RING/FYVE/PHD-type n=1 Tax=Cynara cardunculus var. scolymus TaxID=59895 RepID=A0A103XWK8_CYNCS|nr:Zinc finger, RING/FYVE/PHD-type [Cynara cardunculus var. scolymus]